MLLLYCNQFLHYVAGSIGDQKSWQLGIQDDIGNIGRIWYRRCSNLGALKVNYSLQRRLQLEPKNWQAGERAPKLGRRLRAAIRTVLYVSS